VKAVHKKGHHYQPICRQGYDALRRRGVPIRFKRESLLYETVCGLAGGRGVLLVNATVVEERVRVNVVHKEPLISPV
jgi:hypothetical protein